MSGGVCMDHIPEFEITSYHFSAKEQENWVFPYDYHYLYILENGKQAYIGETNDIRVRSKQHRQKADFCSRFRFQRIHVITGRDITATPAKHYEKLLIKLMRIDQKFSITNPSDGVRTFYAEKNEFELGFDRLWPKLAACGLVRQRVFQAILNASEFKYSPFTRLTTAQQQTLESIVNALHCSASQRQRNAVRNRPILIQGDAGTGKTVIAATLFYHLKSDPAFSGKQIALVYANPATRDELKKVFRCVPGGFEKEIICPTTVTKKRYDILICDEAQCLRRNRNLGMYITHFRKGNTRLGLGADGDELDWLLANSEDLVLLYDKKQAVNPADIPDTDFTVRLALPDGGTRPVALTEQLRIRAGGAYVPYLYDILYQRSPVPQHFDGYDLRLFSSFRAMWEQLRQREAETGLCRLCSNYGWKWSSKLTPEQPDIVLEGIGIWWNRQTGGWLRNPEATAEMGSIYSLVGLDLNYAAVVMGPELVYDENTGTIQVNKSVFFDNKVKSGVTDAELLTYVLNTYAVLLTRGIRGTYLYVCDPALRAYMARFFPTC